jgi:salicylate hydroxylase
MVTIIGGGIAGTVLAGALARDGIPVTVYERRPIVDDGAFLVLDDGAHRTLADLGVPVEELRAVSHEVSALSVSGPNGPARSLPGDGRRLYCRPDLMRVLTESAHATKAEFHYERPVTDIDIDSGTVYFGDDSVSGRGPIIGADGIDSAVRARLEPDRAATYAGQVVVYGITTVPVSVPSTESELHFRVHRTENPLITDAFGHQWNEHISVWFARIARPPIPVRDTGIHPADVWARAIHAAVPSLPDLIGTLLDATETVHVSNARNVPLADARTPNDNVILCGDADHAITPAAGVGARDAIEDAAALHRAITAGTSPAAAMIARRESITAARAAAARFNARRE